MKTLFPRFTWTRGVREPEQMRATFELRLGNLLIGTLVRDGNEWVFSYSKEFANQSEIGAIVDFPAVDRVYRSSELWPFFTLRIPSLNQAHVQRYLKSKGKDTVDAADLMEEFGRHSIANPFVLESV